MKNYNEKLMENILKLSVFNTSQDPIFPFKTHTLFASKNTGIDKQCSLSFDQNFGMCNVFLPTSPQPKESNIIPKASAV